ncbi:DUF2239 family protein [Variovorax sp. J22R133]|uniref:DUF2239 family protein n=1 Tax=Variovorax brevis TaxID=3053503 RepID=UPI002576CF97|nr:DUF2239 family protein [Variovorax sp. J22R133]MDM0110964.1 DUF2239 family protein [Variovorax sp. J22R133]
MPTETAPEHADIPPASLTAFAGFQKVASGPTADVIAQLRQNPAQPDVLLRVFDDATGKRFDVDLRPEAAEGTASANAPAAAPPRGVGRPRLGVVAREVTLLPRHWDWLNRQPGGASVALRRLVDEARRVYAERDSTRAARESAYTFMTEMAGDLPHFEEAARALFAGERTRFGALVAEWPQDVRSYLQSLSQHGWNPQ